MKQVATRQLSRHTRIMMMNLTLSRHLKPIAIATMLIVAVPVLAQNAVYRWTGEDGVVHYGATPPLGVEAELVKAGSSGSGSADDEESSGTSETGEATEAGEEKPEPVKLSPEMQARKDSLCKEEHKRLENLNKPGRIRMQQPDGSSRYLTMEEVQAEINTTQQVISDTCK